MFEKKVLDKGFIRLLNISGAVTRDTYEFDGIRNNEVKHLYHPFTATDTDPALVARTSFANGLLDSSKALDERLVEYLVRNEHTTPLEFTTVYLEFKLPIFCARQVIRHRTGNLADNNTGNEPTVNEVSGRYVTLPNDWYIPEVVRGKHSGGNKQGSEDNLSEEVQIWFNDMLETACNYSYGKYLEALESDVCPEQARMFLHLNHYTQFVWKQDLHNLMHFLSLRLDKHAQWEVRQYAEAIYELLKEHLPKSMEWFDTYRRKLDDEEKTVLGKYLTYMTTNPDLDWFAKDEDDLLAVIIKLAKRQGLKV
jgi:thymidylate synthase (FAD)